ncbi:MAG TPA: sulfite exporter TauE/SafE family protein [Acidimicrobiales bacterium]|nr:sulfite exporter TauE/SafE family protein [Acidimicrobiales bacterium]
MGLHEQVGLGIAAGLAALGIFAGWLGAAIGIGGGVIVVPALVLGSGFDTEVAVATSLIAVVATSAAAGSAYAGAGQTNLRLALALEIATTVGGLVGGVVAVLIAPTAIDAVFAVVMLLTAALVLRGRDEHGSAEEADKSEPALSSQASLPAAEAGGPAGGVAQLVATGKRVGWEERGSLGGAYLDQATGSPVRYRAVRLWIGWSVSLLAGMLSGLLGVGGGFLKVPAMHLGMKVPIKVSAATSNFMIGVTAIASLFVYFARGYVLPLAAAPVALGIALGAYAGARSSQRVSAATLRRILAAVLVLVAVQMGLKAVGGLGV